MESTQEVAVLQSALLLAEKKCTCLAKLGKNGDPKVTLILTDAVAEIMQGLKGDLDLSQREEMQFKVGAVLLAVYLSDKGTQSSDDFWFSVLQGMPSINSAILFDLLKKSHLQQALFKILNNVDLKLGLHILHDLIDYVDLEADEQDFLLLVDIMDYLFLQENPYMFEARPDNLQQSVSTTQLEVCTHLSKLSKKSSALDESPEFCLVKDGKVINHSIVALFDMLPERFRMYNVSKENAIVITSVSNILSCLTSGQGIVINTGNNNRLSLRLSEFLKEKSLKKTFPPSEAKSLFLQMQDKYLTKTLIHKAHSKLVKDHDTLATLTKHFIAMTTDGSGEICNLDCFVQAVNAKEPEVVSTEVSSLGAKRTARKTTQSTSDAGVSGVISGYFCRTVLDQLVGVEADKSAGMDPGVSQISKEMLLVKDEDLLSQLGEKKWEWCRVATSTKLHAHKQLFVNCMEDNVPKRSMNKFVDFVEKNLELLGSAEVMKKWLEFVARFAKEDKKSMTIATMRMMTLAAHKKLPLLEQAEVILYAHEELDSKFVFGSGDHLKITMTSAFNRLVKSQGNLKNSIGAVSELLLQAPKQTLEKMVNEAVYKNGLDKMMAEIMQLLPTLGRLEVNKVPLLVSLIGQAVQWKLERNEEQNLLSFIRHLLMVPPEVCPLILNKVHLVESVVSPNLVLSTSDTKSTAGSSSIAVRAISILLVTMATTEQKNTGWVLQVQPIPLVMCLCHMLDNCCPLFSEDSAGGEALRRCFLREQLIAVVTQLTNWLAHLNDRLTEKAVTWLYNSLLQLHWTTLLYVEPLFTAIDCVKYPMRVPEGIQKIAELPKEWITFRCERYDEPMYLTLEAVRVPGIASHLTPINNVQLDIASMYTRAVSSLGILLPNSLASEAEDMITWLVSTEVFRDLHPLHLIRYHRSLKREHYKDVEQELSLCTLLHDVMLVLSEGGLHEQCLQQNLHIAQNHVILIQRGCIQTRVETNVAACVLLTEIFGRLCQHMACVPENCTEPIYVLLLDILQMYGGMRARLAKEGQTDNYARQVLTQQVNALNTSIGLCHQEEQTMLLKTLIQQKLE